MGFHHASSFVIYSLVSWLHSLRIIRCSRDNYRSMKENSLTAYDDSNIQQALRPALQTDDFPVRQQYNIVDLLRTSPSSVPFPERVRKISLSRALEEKIIAKHRSAAPGCGPVNHLLTENDEKELAGEVLMFRHTFTRRVFANHIFRQAALTIVQNIYLFKQRRIFFGTPADDQGEAERREALVLFSGSPANTTIPLAKSFQHLILARVWDRIINQASNAFLQGRAFAELHEVVEQLNTLRNIYMLLSLGIVHKLTANISRIYQQSISREDAKQIGSFGIARAAYRYHPSCGLRFSSYASHWIQKEIQRQALDGRLIRISANLVEKISREAKDSIGNKKTAFAELLQATVNTSWTTEETGHTRQSARQDGLDSLLERRQVKEFLVAAMDKVLSPESRDMVMRRYGIGPYQGNEQSVMEIAAAYGVTRSSIYQRQLTALNKLKEYLATTIGTSW